MGSMRTYLDKKAAAKMLRSIKADIDRQGYAISEDPGDGVNAILDKIAPELHLVPIGVRSVDEKGNVRQAILLAAREPDKLWKGAQKVFELLAVGGATPESIKNMREQLRRQIEARSGITLPA